MKSHRKAYGRCGSRKFSLIALIIIFSVTVIFEFGSLVPAYSDTLPPYAKVGAFADYTSDGGFIAFMSGVSGNISYHISSILQNGTMELTITGNLSFGTEAGIPTSNVTMTEYDQTDSPKYFPAISSSELFSRSIDFQNISCTFQGYSRITVPAGTFESVEFQGNGANASLLDFWFDNATGLALQMSGSAAELQLKTTNIATPLVAQSSISTELSIVVVFVSGWVLAGVLFYAVRRHYVKKSQINEPNLLPTRKLTSSGDKYLDNKKAKSKKKN